MKNFKTPHESYYETRKIVSFDLLNPNETLFGGHLLAWIDEIAFMTARRFAGVPYVVTVAMDNITFLEPFRAGENVVLSASVNYVGRTSMEIGVKVAREDSYTGKRKQTNSAYCTFVALNKNGKPISVPRLKLETPEDHRRYEEAKLRIKSRAELRRQLKAKLNFKNSSEKEVPEKHVLAIQRVRDYITSVMKINLLTYRRQNK